eukprot:CAMPEP_0118996100 /NCGR_PEP_ID=MMETSP1173-20130426/59500_1 /TAXON_ID=1034831 /ORGANISM="Rhizochromulina marina cf, Strain CCMP1243" /LENGTH=87 /DNA_ID=CAMNT_0006947475 /DNA_START=165 /DNA_END=424 /DNA_ORIENTATION=+
MDDWSLRVEQVNEPNISVVEEHLIHDVSNSATLTLRHSVPHLLRNLRRVLLHSACHDSLIAGTHRRNNIVPDHCEAAIEDRVFPDAV